MAGLELDDLDGELTEQTPSVNDHLLGWHSGDAAKFKINDLPGGSQGPAGEGVPEGGTSGQVLAKASGDDFDTEWVDPPEGGGDDRLPDPTEETAGKAVVTDGEAGYELAALADVATSGSYNDLTDTPTLGTAAAADAGDFAAATHDHDGTYTKPSDLAAVATSGDADDITVADVEANFANSDLEAILAEIAGGLDLLSSKADLIGGTVPAAQTPTLIIQKTILEYGAAAPSDGIWARYTDPPLVGLSVSHIGTFLASGNTGSAVITLTADVEIGDVVVVGGSLVGGGRTFTGIADSKSNTWVTNLATSTSPGSPSMHCELFYSVITNAMSAGDTITVSASSSTNGLVAIAAKCAGYSGTPDANPTNADSSRFPTLTTVAANNDSVVFAFISSQSNRPVVDYDDDWTELGNGASSGASSNPAGALYCIQVETGADVTFDCEFPTSSSQWSAVQLELT